MLIKYPNAISDRLQVSFSLARSQSIIAHLAFDDLGLPAMVARHHALFEDLIKYGIMKDGFLPRGNSAEGRQFAPYHPHGMQKRELIGIFVGLQGRFMIRG
jgi:hypothetical protein